MFAAQIRGEIQTKLRQFDGNFRAQTSYSDAFQNFEIVFRNLLRLGAILDVFAQVSEDRSDLLSTQNLCGSKCVVERLAGHEPRDAAPYKRVMRRAMSQPLILRCCQQHRSHKTHECLLALESKRLRLPPAHYSKPHRKVSCFSIFRENAG